jgi:hypothetical protein
MNGGMSNERVTTNAYQNNASYYGQSISQLNDKNKMEEEFQTNKRGSNVIEDQFNKKQIEFKGGKLNQMISD